MTSQTTQEPAAARRTPFSLIPGVILGIVSFVVLSWVSAQWLHQVVRNGSATWFLVLGAALTGAAVYLTVRYPSPGLAAGATMAGLVVLGLLLGNPRDFGLDGTLGGWDPVSIVRHGAYQPLLSACAAALLAAGTGVRLHRS